MRIEPKVVQDLRVAQDQLLALTNQLGKVAEQARRGLITAKEATQQEVRILSDVIGASRKMVAEACEVLEV